MAYANSSGTKCPKCENTSFEMAKDFPTDGRYFYYYLRCGRCKTFLQAMPVDHTNTLIEQLQKQVKELSADLTQIKQLLRVR